MKFFLRKYAKFKKEVNIKKIENVKIKPNSAPEYNLENMKYLGMFINCR